MCRIRGRGEGAVEGFGVAEVFGHCLCVGLFLLDTDWGGLHFVEYLNSSARHALHNLHCINMTA